MRVAVMHGAGNGRVEEAGADDPHPQPHRIGAHKPDRRRVSHGGR